jgi:hypothetical protein
MPRGVLLTPAGEALARDAQRLPGGLVDVAFLREPVEMPATLSFDLPDEKPMLLIQPQEPALLKRRHSA